MPRAARMLSFLFAVPLLAGCAARAPAFPPPAPTKPNILLIVADDMGYSDIAPFGSEVATPNLTLLAQRGTVMTNFHVAPACSPTRAMLLTGRDNHIAGLGNMAEVFASRPYLQAYPGYEGYLSPKLPTLAEELRGIGYQTFMAGKWHLGETESQSPQARGFNRSYALLIGAANHYGADQAGAWLNTRAAPAYREDGVLTTFPQGQYSTDIYTDHMLRYLTAEPAPDRPFFAYLAYTAPHWPLQAPPASVAKYRGRYDGGWAVLRKERWERAKALGIIPQNLSEQDLPRMPDWDALKPEEKRVEARKMEIYAAMIDRMDENIGRVLTLLEQQGRLKNTIVFFMSDNGPAASGPGHDYLPMDPDGMVKLGIDNRMDNLGRATSYASYHPGWAIASATPFKGVKGSTYEGGIRTSAIIAGPGISAGQIDSHFAHVMDVKPTMEWLAGGKRQAATLDRGESWAFLLSGQHRQGARANRKTGWELGLNQAVRAGDWKAVWISPISSRSGQSTGHPAAWELYDVAADPSESRDLATLRSKTLAQMKALWSAYARTNNVLGVDQVIRPDPAPGGKAAVAHQP